MISRGIAGSDRNEIQNVIFRLLPGVDLNGSSQAQYCRYIKTVPQLLRDDCCKVYN